MTTPSIPNTFTASTVAQSALVNANFTALLNAITDGTQSLNISQMTATTFIGSLTGNASGTAGNITATTNNTLVTLSSLTTATALISIGTITTGTWTATKIAATYGGTGIDTHASTGVPSISAGTWSVAGTLSTVLGGTGVGSVTTTPTASAFAGWDAAVNLSANNLVDGFTTQAAANSTLTLTNTSTSGQIFTGTTSGQVVKLPVVATGGISGGVLPIGFSYTIVNLSNQTVTVQSSGGNTLQAMAANTQLICNSILQTGTTTTSWVWAYTAVENALASGTITALTGDVTASGSGSVAATLAATTNATLATLSALTSVGTIATGVWHGTAVGAQWGGTGIDTHSSSGVPTVASGTWSLVAQAMYSGYLLAAGGVWSTSSTTFADFGTQASNTLTTIINVGFGTPVILTGTLPGVTVTLPYTGYYTVTATAQCFTSTAAQEFSLRLVDGSGTVINPGISSFGSGAIYGNVTLVGLYNGTAGTTSFKIQGATASALDAINLGNGAAAGVPAVTFTIVPVR